MRAWNSFADSAADDVLLRSLGYLHGAQVVALAAASASSAARLTAEGEFQGGAAQRLAIAKLGPVASAAAITATGPLTTLRVLVRVAPAAEALRLALVLARPVTLSTERFKRPSTGATMPTVAAGGSGQRPAPDAAVGGFFVDALFCSEVQQRLLHMSHSACSVSRIAAAANAALTALLSASEAGSCRIIAAVAAAVRIAEHDLDALVDGGVVKGFHRGYEVVARRRSGAEFLRSQLVAANIMREGEDGEARLVKDELDAAAAALDETIRSYIREGYDLGCPTLAGGVACCSAVPYEHWWVFLGRPYSQGYATLSEGPGLRDL